MPAADTGFPVALWLIPLILLITVGGLFAVARYYQTRTRAELDQLRGDWRKFESAYREVQVVAQGYLDEAEEPYLSRIRSLKGSLTAVDRLAGEVSRKRVDLIQRANYLAANPWRSFIGAPYLWFLLYRETKFLGRQVDHAWDALETVARQEEDLAEIGWKLAEQARELKVLQSQAQATLDDLRLRSVHGDAFDKALAKEGRLRAELRRQPAYFFDGDRESVLNQGSQEDIIQLNQMLSSARPALEKLLAQAQQWQRQAQAAVDAVAGLRKALDEATQNLETLPKSIQTGEARGQIAGMEQVTATLQNTLSRLEADSAARVAEDASGMAQAAAELTSLLKRARREHGRLEIALDELPKSSRDLSDRIAALGARPDHPLQMRSSLDQLTSLNRQSNKLGGVRKQRSPQQILEDLESAAAIRQGQLQFSARIDAIEKTHAALLEALHTSPLDDLDAWLKDARKLSADATAYAPENWSRADQVPNLPADLDQLETAARELALHAPNDSIPEDQLEPRLETARRLAENVTGLQRRKESVKGRLAVLQQTEQAARQTLDDAARELTQIEFLVRGNTLLSAAASQQVERIQRDLTAQQEELGRRMQGPLERKSAAAEQLVARLERSANGWLDELQQDAASLNKHISATLQYLDEIAPLQESAVERARELLEDAPAQRAQAGSGRAQYPLKELVARLRDATGYWESCTAAVNSLDDFQPLIDTYADASQGRAEARQAFSETVSWLRKKSAWPPTTVSLDGERQELEKTEAQWNELRTTPTRAIQRVAQLGSLGARYRAITDRIIQAAERAEREATEVDELEAQIDGQASLWQGLYQQHRAHPDAVAEIRELLETVSRDHEAIKRKYFSGSLDFPGVVTELKKVLRRLMYFQVQLDEDSALDIRGNVNRRRDSRRVARD